MHKKIILAGLFLTLFFIFSSTPLTAQAAFIDPSDGSYEYGSYSLNDIMGIVIGASKWILGIVGSLALLMFIYGGFMFLISAGSSDKIGQAQKILVAAVVGLVIVFASYMIISFVAQSLGATWKGGKIIPASSTTKTTTSAKTTNTGNTCEEFANTSLGAGFACRAASGAGFCATNHSCTSGLCCYEKNCSTEKDYRCINWTNDNATDDCTGHNNMCPAEANKNMKCCKLK